jgi:hypothetical protein
MTLMEITTVIGCKVKCNFCPQDLLIKEYSSMNDTENITYGSPEVMGFEMFKTCLSKIPKSVPIAFSGYAEPFLNLECAKMIAYAHDSGYSIKVFSTLVGLTVEDIDLIKHIPFQTFQVHLPDEEMFAKIAVNKKYLEVVKKLITSNIKKLTGMTMGTLHPSIKEILKTDITANVMNNRSGNIVRAELTENDLKFIDIKHERKKGPLVCDKASRISHMDKLDENVLLPNGDVALCCNDYGLKNILGNLTKSSYSSLFHNKNYENIVKEMKSEDSGIICRNCNFAINEKEFNEEIDSYNKKYSNNPNALSIVKLYQDLLKRYPDDDGFNFFNSKLSNHELNIKDIEIYIKKSPEYKSMHPPSLSLNNY